MNQSANVLTKILSPTDLMSPTNLLVIFSTNLETRHDRGNIGTKKNQSANVLTKILSPADLMSPTNLLVIFSTSSLNLVRFLSNESCKPSDIHFWITKLPSLSVWPWFNSLFSFAVPKSRKFVWFCSSIRWHKYSWLILEIIMTINLQRLASHWSEILMTINLQRLASHLKYNKQHIDNEIYNKEHN